MNEHDDSLFAIAFDIFLHPYLAFSGIDVKVMLIVKL